MREVVLHGVYRHFKGNEYYVEDIAIHSETEERLVVYRALYGERRLFARPYELFVSTVDREKYPDATQEYRFELMTGKDAPKEEHIGEKGNEKETVEEAMDEAADGGEVTLDPLVIEFLDASSYEQRLNILSALHHKITDDMINIMSIALDIEVKPGDVEERYAEFRGCLALMEKYECNRLR